MAILSILLTVIIIAVSILLVLIVLIQRPKQEGLGAAFGGGSLDSALGAHTTDILQKFTTWLGVIFFLSAIGLAMVKTREFRDSAASDLLEGVEAKQPDMPGLPPELMNLPGLENLTADPATAPGEAPASPATTPTESTSESAPTPEAATPAPAPAPESAPAPEAATPAPAAPAADSAGDGKAKGE
ncbi:MAG: preprotein translocase subunit SecG [Verrucomicrobiaceae bacterium]|nr:preprotein translocase subunit SecG [Verrucomicrobiaceae bacterium]